MKPTWNDHICTEFERVFRAAFGPVRARQFRIGPYKFMYRIWRNKSDKFADRSEPVMQRLIERLEKEARSR